MTWIGHAGSTSQKLAADSGEKPIIHKHTYGRKGSKMKRSKGNGRSIMLYLADGTGEGYVRAEAKGYSTKAVKFPRSQFPFAKEKSAKDFGKEPEKIKAVYLLIGTIEKTGKKVVYIGQSTTLFNRLKNHLAPNKKGFYWHTAIFCTDPDLDGEKTEYAENEFFMMAQKSSFEVKTDRTRKAISLRDSDLEFMEKFIDFAKEYITAFGYKELVCDTPKQAGADTPTFFLNGKGASAEGFLSLNGFTVREGSRISSGEAKSLNKRYANLRRERGTIRKGVFVKDREYSSPSEAACVVLGNSVSGKSSWKTSDGLTINQMQMNASKEKP